MSKETYQQGMIDAIQMWGTVCGGHNCENCAIGSVRNTNVSCQEFARKHPEKMLSLLTSLCVSIYSQAIFLHLRITFST